LHFVLGIKPGETILWHAGASGVSIAGIQLSRAAGSGDVFATAGSDEKCSFVEKELGAAKAVNYKATPQWSEEIKKATNGKGVDLIVDFVGGSYFQQNLDALAMNGRMVMLGFLGGSTAKDVNIGAILFKKLRIEGSTLRSRDLDYQGKLRDKLETYLPQFESGKFKLFVDTVLPFEEIVKGHKIMEENKNLGKIVCTIS
jgi:NADPH:quinone reductase-like Zn-dependent oxidoreductase